MKNNSQAIVDEYLTPPDVHVLRLEQHFNLLIPMIIAIISLVVHGVNVYLLLYKNSTILMFLAIHVLMVALTALIARIRTRSGSDGRFMTLMATTTAFMGPFAAGGVILCLLMYMWFRMRAIPFAEWFQSIFPFSIPSMPETVHEDIISGRDENSKLYSVIPFMDVMVVGSEAQKAQALAKMTLQFHPSFAPAFRIALNDRSNMIRVQAATAITKIENQFLDRLMKITSVRQRWPEDNDVLLALAEHYDNYAYTGILDYERERLNRGKALELYMEYLRKVPENTDVRGRVGRLLLRSNQAEEAATWFRESIELGQTSDSIALWYLESLYRAGWYGELRQAAGSNLISEKFRHDLPPALREAIGLWTDQPKTEKAA